MNLADTSLQGFHFLRPLWLLALPPLLLLCWQLARRHSQAGNWNAVIDAELLSALQLEAAGATARSQSPWPWLALAWSLATVALAGPSWQREQTAAFRAPADWVLVLDLSPSMLAGDLAPTRLARARYAINDLLDQAHDARVGLVVFGEEAFTVTPLTEDVATVRALLPPLSPDLMPTPGDVLAPALDAAGQLLKASPNRNSRVIVFSDGFDDPAAAFAAAARLRKQGSELDVLGLATATGAPLAAEGGGFQNDASGKPALQRLDAGSLGGLASAGGGRFVELPAWPAMVSKLAAAQAANGAGSEPAKGLALSHWRDGGVWLLPLLLLAAAVLARRGWL